MLIEKVTICDKTIKYVFWAGLIIICIMAVSRLASLCKAVENINTNCLTYITRLDSNTTIRFREVDAALRGFGMYVEAQERQYNELVDSYQKLSGQKKVTQDTTVVQPKKIFVRKSRLSKAKINVNR